MVSFKNHTHTILIACFFVSCLVFTTQADPRSGRGKSSAASKKARVQADSEAEAATPALKPDEMRQILMGGGDASRRQQLIKSIAELVKAKTGDCPKSLPAEMCKQPLTFFMWLNEVRNQAKEKEMYNAVRKILVQMLAGKPMGSKN